MQIVRWQAKYFFVLISESIEMLGNCRTREQDIFNSMGSMYAAVLFIGFQNSASVQPVVAVERTVFYRERAAGMYSALPYAFGQVILSVFSRFNKSGFLQGT